MALTKISSSLIKSGAITANSIGDAIITPDKLHTSVAQEGLHANSSGLRVNANTGVTANSSGLFIGQDVAIGANVEFGVVKFANYYAQESDLPSSTTYHGMFAHVHNTGKAYFAHAAAWRKLLDEDSSNTDVLTEGPTNLYFTNARSIAAFSNGTGVSVYSNGNIAIDQSVATTANVTFNTVTANVVGTFTGTVSDISNHSTDDLSEGATNLYFSNARAIGALSNGTGVSINSTGYVAIGQAVATTSNVTFNVVTGNLTGNVTGTVSSLSNHDTDDLSEGATNLYFTNARVPAALSNGTGVSVYSNGNIAIGQSVGTTDSVTFANVVTTDITISGNLIVSGTTTTIDSTNLSVNDSIITLASGQSGTPALDAGLEVERGTSANVYIKWNETNDKWTFTNDGSTYVNVATSTTELAEGTNQYFTNARAIGALSNGTGVSVYSNGTISIGQDVGTTASMTIGDLVITGNLTVQGVSNQSTSTSAAVSNADLVLLSDHTGAPSNDARLIVNRGTSANVNIKWDETNDKWTFTNDGSTYANIATSTTDLAEGTNQYYTVARANSAIDARVTTAFVDALNVDADTLDTLNSTQFLRSDQADSMSGNLTVTDTITATQTVRAGNVYMTAAGSIYRTDTAGAGGFHITTNALYSGNSSGGVTDGVTSLGSASYRWNKLWIKDISAANNITVDKNDNSGVYVRVNNANTGTQSYTSLQLGDSGSSNRGGITLIGSGFTQSAQYRQTETYIYNNGSSGITLHSEAAASSLKIAVNNNLMQSANSSVTSFGTITSLSAGATRQGVIDFRNGTESALSDIGFLSIQSSANNGITFGANSSQVWIYGRQVGVDARNINLNNKLFVSTTSSALAITANGNVTATGSVTADEYIATMATSGSGDNQAAMRFSADHQGWDTLYAGTPGSTNGWGTFWAGSVGAQYGTNGTGGVGNIWSNSSNPNEFVIVGGGQSSFAVQMYEGNSWTKNTADVGTDGSVNNTGVGIRYGNYSSGYGRIRFYQGGTNHSTIHSFSSLWQGGSLAGHSTGAINIEGQTGVSFGAWNGLDGYIDTSGNMTMAGSITANSDRRIKTNIETIEDALDKVLKLRGVRFNKTEKGDPDKKYIGVIAQEVEEILPEVVKKADDERGTLSVDYGNMVGLLIEAIKEQQGEINRLRDIIEGK